MCVRCTDTFWYWFGATGSQDMGAIEQKAIGLQILLEKKNTEHLCN